MAEQDPPKKRKYSADNPFASVEVAEPPKYSEDNPFAQSQPPGKSVAPPPQQPPALGGGGGAAPTFSAISPGLLEPPSEQAAPTDKQYSLAPETADITQATTPEQPFTPAQVAQAAPGRKEAAAERVLFNEKFAGMDLPTIKKYREESVAKADANARVLQQLVQQDAQELEQQRVQVEQARQAYQRDHSPEAAANFDMVAGRYNSSVSMLERQQKAVEDARTVAERENRLLDLQEYSLKAQQGTTAGALWNNMLNSIGGAVSGLNSPFIDLYLAANPQQRSEGETQQQADDRLRRRMRGQLRGAATEGLGDPATTNEYIDEFSKGSFYKEALMGATGSLPLIATGPVGMMTQAMDGVDKEMEAPEFDGVPQWKKRLFSATVGSAVGTLERLGFRNVARNSPMMSRILLKAIDEIPPGATGEQIQAILDQRVKEGAEGAIIRFMSAGLSEAETGGSQALVEPALKEGFNASENLRNADISPTEARIRDLFAAMDGKQLFETPDGLDGYVTATAKGAALEAIGGFMYATPYAASNAFRKNKLGETTTPKQFEMVEELAKDPNFPAFFEEQAAKDVEEGHITPEQAQQAKQDFSTVTKLMDRIPDDLPVGSRMKAFDILSQLNGLSKKEPALVANKVEALKQQLQELEGVPVPPEATVDAEDKKGEEPPPVQPTGDEHVEPSLLETPTEQPTAVEDVSTDAASGTATEIIEPTGVGAPVSDSVTSSAELEGEPGGVLHDASDQAPPPVPPEAPASVPLPERPVSDNYIKPDLSRDVSDDPVALASAYIDEHIANNDDSTLDDRIGTLVGNNISADSFKMFGDVNKITKDMKRAYLRENGGRTLDDLAQELSSEGEEVSPQDIVEYVLRNPAGKSATTPRSREIAERYYGITGKRMNSLVAKSILKGKKVKWTPEEQAIVDEAQAAGVDLSEINDDDVNEFKEMSDEDADLFFGSRDTKKTISQRKLEADANAKAAEQVQSGGAAKAPSEVRSAESTRPAQAADPEEERLAEVLKTARAERDKFVNDWNDRGQGLFAPEVGQAQQTIDGGFNNSQENFDAKVEPLNERVRQATKALADYVDKAADRKKAAAQQTSIPEVAPKEKAPKVEKPAEQVKSAEKATPTTPVSFKRPNPSPVTKPTVLRDVPSSVETKEYAIQGFEEYPVVVFKEKGGWKAVLRVGGLDMEIASGEPTHGIAAGAAHEKMARAGKPKLDGIVESLLNKEEGPREMRPIALPPTITINGKERPTTNSKGQPIAQTEEGVRNFYEWFGDSKVVDAQGRPLVVYHATNKDFDAFVADREHGWGAAYFSVDPNYASSLVGRKKGEENLSVVAAYLRIDDLLDLVDLYDTGIDKGLSPSALSRIEMYGDVFDGIDLAVESLLRFNSAIEPDVRKALQTAFEGEYGGVRGYEEGFVHDKVVSFAVRNPSQIKSATGNSGAFDPKNPDITQQRPTDRAPKTGKPNTDKAMKALQGVAPGFKVIAPSNKADYQKAIENFPDAVKSSWGLYDQASNTAYINPEGPDVRNTLFHESGHPLLMALRQTFPEKFAAFHEQIIGERGGMYRRFATDNYKDKSKSVQQEEALAQFLADVADGTVPVSMQPDSLWQQFKAFIQDLLASLGWDTRSIDMSKPDNVRDFAAQFKKAMDKGIKMTGLKMADGAQIMQQRPKTTKATEWNAAVDDAVKNAFVKEQPQAIQDAANLITDPDGKAEFIKVMSEQWGITTPPAGNKANQKKVSRVFLHDELMKAVAAGKRAGAADISKARKEFAKAVKEALKNDLHGRLKPKQAEALIARAALTNPDSQRAVAKFFQYAERVIDNANYAEDLATAQSLQKKAKRIAKNKSIPVNLKDSLRGIAAVDIAMVEDPAAFTAQVGPFMDSFEKIPGEKYSMGSSETIDKYVAGVAKEADAARQKMMEEEMREKMEEFEEIDSDALDAYMNGPEAFEEYLDGKAKAKQQAIRDAAMQMADSSKAELADMDKSSFTPKEQQIIKSLEDMPLDKLSNGQLASYVFGVDNLIINESFDGLEGLAVLAKAIQGGDRIIESSKSAPMRSGPATTKGGEAFQSMFYGMQNVNTKLVGFVPAAGDFSVDFGTHGVDKGRASTDKTVREENEALVKFVAEKNKEGRKNGRDVSSAKGIASEGMVGFALQLVPGKSAQDSFDIQKKIIQEDIEKNGGRKQYAKEYEIIQSLYDELLAKVNSAEELKEAYKKAMPENAAVVDWLIAMGHRHSDETLSHNRRFRNQSDVADPNYLTKTYDSVPGILKDAGKTNDEKVRGGSRYDQFLGKLHKPTQASSLIGREKHEGLPFGRKINYGLRGNSMSALQEQLYDARTSAHWLQMYEMLRLKNAAEIFGGEENLKWLSDHAAEWYNAQTFKAVDPRQGGRAADKVSRILRGLASVWGLGGVTQAIAQPADQLTNAFLMSNDKAEFGKTMRDVAAVNSTGLYDLLSLGAIGERGEQLGGARFSSTIEAQERRLSAALENGAVKEAEAIMAQMGGIWMSALTKSDTYAARVAWVTFYKHYLKTKGVDAKSWSEEANLVMDEDRTRNAAFAYAEQMTAQTQGPNDPSMFSPWARRSDNGWMNLLKSIGNPFSSFTASVRARIANAAGEMWHYKSASALVDSPEGDRFKAASKVLTSTVASQAAYAATKIYIIKTLLSYGATGLLAALAKAYDDGGDDDDEVKAMERIAAVSDLMHTFRLMDRDANKVVQEAYKRRKQSRLLGAAYDEQKDLEDKAAYNYKTFYTMLVRDMTVSGFASGFDDATIDGMNWTQWATLAYTGDKSVQDRNGELIPFDKWKRDPKNTTFVRYGQWSDKPSYGQLSLVWDKAAGGVADVKSLVAPTTSEDLDLQSAKAINNVSRIKRIENANTFRSFVEEGRSARAAGATDDERMAIRARYKEWMKEAIPKQDWIRMTEAYYKAVTSPEVDPWYQITGAISNPRDRAVAFYQRYRGADAQERKEMTKTAAKLGIMSPSFQAEFIKLKRAEANEPDGE